MAYYRVLEGSHYGPGPQGCDCDACYHNSREKERQQKELAAGQAFVPRLRPHRYKKGEIVETDSNLLDYNQGSRSMKFERVDKVGRPISKKSEQIIAPPPVEEINAGDGLDEMTVDELRRLAEEEEIDLGNNTRKSDIIKAIRSGLMNPSMG